jgi:non-ribosomal peptide synthetase component E (peptide arylation enzyme)
MDSEQRVWAPQMPQVLHFVEAIPRNAMGKVNKKALLKDVFMRD